MAARGARAATWPAGDWTPQQPFGRYRYAIYRRLSPGFERRRLCRGSERRDRLPLGGWSIRPATGPCDFSRASAGGRHCYHRRRGVGSRGQGGNRNDTHRIRLRHRPRCDRSRHQPQSTWGQYHWHQWAAFRADGQTSGTSAGACPERPVLIGVLLNPSYSGFDIQLQQLQEAAGTLRQELHVENARTEREIGVAFEAIIQRRASAILVANDPFFFNRATQFVVLAARHAIPTLYWRRELAAAGGLISYGPDQIEQYRVLGVYAARILKGEKPGDLPVQLPTRFELVINLMTAKALGLDMPPTLLARADEVIE